MGDAGTTRVLIVGAGIGGLSAAIALRRAGVEVTVFESMGKVAEVGAGLMVWSNGVRALEMLGIADDVVGQGVRLDRVESRLWRGSLLSTVRLDQVERKVGGRSVAIHRGRLVALLAGALGEGFVQVNSRCTGYAQDAVSVTVQVADGRTERGDVLVAADGLRSTMRAQRFGEVPPRYAGTATWRGLAQCEHDAFRPGLVLQVRGQGAVFGITALAGGSAYWYGSVLAPEGEEDPPGERKSRVLDQFGSWYEPVTAVLDATEESAILRTDIYDRRPIKGWGAGRVTLLGDAAHPTVPSLGQGACMAIEDAVALTRCLSSDDDQATAIRRYERLRVTRTARMVRLARQVAWVDHWENPVARALRDAVFQALPDEVLSRQLERVINYIP